MHMQTQKGATHVYSSSRGCISRGKVADWWKNHKTKIPAWAQACKLILLVQLSSASAE